MNWTKKELTNLIDVEIDEEIEFDLQAFSTHGRLNALRNVNVHGSGHYDCATQQFEVAMDVAGDMIVPCAVTLEDVTVPFEFTANEIFSFINVEEDDVHVCHKSHIEIYPVLFQLILAEVPLKVVKDDASYPKGDGWEVMSEREYREKMENEIDPRLAKLKDFKIEES